MPNLDNREFIRGPKRCSDKFLFIQIDNLSAVNVGLINYPRVDAWVSCLTSCTQIAPNNRIDNFSNETLELCVNSEVIPLSQIRLPEGVKLRGIKSDTEEYVNLTDSIKEKGFLGSILVKPLHTTDEAGQPLYEVVEGSQRFSILKSLNYTEVLCTVKDMSERERLETQIMLNLHRIETRPSEYTEQLKALMQNNPLLTIAELSKTLAKTPKWIEDRLALGNIEDPNIKQIIDSGKMNLQNAYRLAKLPVEEQANWVERAITMSNDEFGAAVASRVNEIKDAKRKGQEAGAEKVQGFVPVPRLRSLAEIKSEIEELQLTNVLNAVRSEGSTKLEDVVRSALKWAVRLDPSAVAEGRAKYDERQLAAKKAAEEREAKKLAEKTAKERAAIASF